MGTEETAFEYAMVLFSVLIGLAIADVAISFHRLMRFRRDVRWDPLTLAAAVYALSMAIYMWFDIWGVRHFAVTRQFLFYLGLIVQLFVLFLIAAASLPDEVDRSTDLRAYYESNRRYFWLLMTLFQFIYSAFGLFFATGESALSLAVTAQLYAIMFAPLAVSIALVFLRSRIVHWIGIVALFGLVFLHYGAARIA